MRPAGASALPTSYPADGRGNRDLSRAGKAMALVVAARPTPLGCSGGFGRMSPEVVVAIVLGQPGWNFLPMEEVAHDPVGDSPVVAVHAVVVRAQRGLPREL